MATAKRKRFVIPKSFTLAGGYRVVAKLVSHRTFLKVSKDGEAKALFRYDVPGEENVIYLDRSRTPAQRRADYCHEKLHACLDWQVKSLGRQDVDSKM